MLDREVLRGEKNFTAVYKKGKSSGSKYVVVFYKRNGYAYNRIAFLASKKVGNAVARNRAKRLMKESVRSMGLKPVGYDIIFIARKTINKRKCADVKKSIEAAMRRTGI
ncbi:MAG: ribonuclease P protein component [Anaerovoracaceae bacterium]|jgi:ribonuclease P protein component